MKKKEEGVGRGFDETRSEETVCEMKGLRFVGSLVRVRDLEERR